MSYSIACPECGGAGVYPKAAVVPSPPDVTCRSCHGSGRAYAATLRQQAARVDEVDGLEVSRAIYARLQALGRHLDPDICDELASAALEAALSAQPAERQGVTDEIVEHVQYSLDNHEDNRDYAEQVSARSVREALEAVWPKASTYPAAPVGVPDGMVIGDAIEVVMEVRQLMESAKRFDEMERLQKLAIDLERMLAAAPSQRAEVK